VLEILYEDAHCLVAVKPAGVLTQGSLAGEPTLEAAVRRHVQPGDPAGAYLGTVHRLDRPVSGVIVWAKTAKAARRLAAQFASRSIKKEYWAIVEGRPDGSAGTWDDWLCVEDTGLGRVQVCRPNAPRARHALTHYETQHRGIVPDGCAWLRLWPETGRTHQLRAQAGAHGVPVLGDRNYGAAQSFEPGIALHARAVTVRHPILDRLMTFEAPVPPSWREHGIELGQRSA
jgi:23S rRNA pseudouridine1911/1915/1917 synthase